MSKITGFNRANLGALRVDLNDALKAVREKYGIKLQIGAITFRELTATAKMTLDIPTNDATTGVSERATGTQKQMYTKMAALHGWPALGATLKNGFIVIGYNSRARSMPIMAFDPRTSRHYKMTRQQFEIHSIK